MKVKVIQAHHYLTLEEQINEFIVNVDVIDIKITHMLDRNDNERLTALIMYKD